jgi:hypothetical protein
VSARDEPADGERTDAGTDDGDRRADGHQARADDRIGDLLPDVTLDESAVGWGDDDGDPDERLTREVPPHHG